MYILIAVVCRLYHVNSLFNNLFYLLFYYFIVSHSNHVTSSKQPNTLICHTTMRRNPINFLYNPGHVIIWCVEVGPVANARELLFSTYPFSFITCYAMQECWFNILLCAPPPPRRNGPSQIITIFCRVQSNALPDHTVNGCLAFDMPGVHDMHENYCW